MCAHVLPPHIHCQSWHRCRNCMCVQGDGWEMLNCTEWECRSCWSHCWCSCSWAHQSVGKLLQLAPASEEQQEVLLKKKIFKTLNKCLWWHCCSSKSYVPSLLCPQKEKEKKMKGLYDFYGILFKQIRRWQMKASGKEEPSGEKLEPFTAGVARWSVSGLRRVPAPPPRIIETTLLRLASSFTFGFLGATCCW
jgi:hypothetical protein